MKVRWLLFSVFAIALLIVGSSTFVSTPSAKAAINPSYIIPDSAFDSTDTYSVSQINSLLNSYSSGCTNGHTYADPEGFSGGSYQFGGLVSAGQAIYDIAQNYHVSPKVILTMLQKEQSVVTGEAGCYPTTPNPSASFSSTPGPNNTFTCTINGQSTTCTYACVYSGGCMNIAMSYDCPGYCKASIEGFSNQLSGGTWILRFAEERAYGLLTGYAGYDSGDEDLPYSGPMTPGWRQRSASDTSTYYDGTWTTSDGQSLNITNGATASLYNYTPFVSGNTTFFNTFTGWFGNPNTLCYSSGNLSGTSSGQRIITTHFASPSPSQLSYTMLNNTGSTCAEIHTMNTGSNAWRSHNQTVVQALDPANGQFLAGDFNGDGKDELLYIVYNGPGHVVNIRTLNSDYSGYVGGGVATPISNFNPSNGEFLAADLYGNGRDELIYVVYNGPGNALNFRVLTPDFQNYAGFGVKTVLSNFNPANEQIAFGDTNGNGRDKMLYIVDDGPGNVVNVRTLSSDYQGYADPGYRTPIANFDPSKETFVTGDMYGTGTDHLLYIVYCGPGNVVNMRTLTANFQDYADRGTATPLHCIDPNS